MALTPAAARLTETYRLAQARLGARVVAQMRSAWGVLNPEDLDGSFERWLRVALPLIQANRATAAALAAGYLSVFRTLELGLAGSVGFHPTLAGAADTKAVTTSLLVTGPWSIKQAMTRGVALTQAVDVAEARTSAAAMRHTLDGGRETIVATVASDHRAVGWARVASGNACAFCAMTASRGPEYKSEQSAAFEAHDGCQCGAEPVYHADAPWPANSQRYRDLWDEHAAGADNPLNTFRQALAQA